MRPLLALNHVLGTQSKVRLLRVLAPLTSPVSGREAQRLAGVRSVSGAGRALDELTDAGILLRDEAGGTYLYSMNREHVLERALLDLFDAEKQILTSLREVLESALRAEGLLDVVRSITVFGSAARGEDRPGSDVDLLFVVESEEAVGPVRATLFEADAAVRRTLGLRVSPYVISYEHAAIRVREGDPLLQIVESEGRVLRGAPIGELLGGW